LQRDRQPAVRAWAGAATADASRRRVRVPWRSGTRTFGQTRPAWHRV